MRLFRMRSPVGQPILDSSYRGSIFIPIRVRDYMIRPIGIVHQDHLTIPTLIV